MRWILSLIAAVTVTAILSPAVARADDWPNTGSVRYYYQGQQAQNRTAAAPIFTPGYGFTEVASNGAVRYYYVRGHANTGNNQGPIYFTPGFRSNYQAPGSLHYYYGSTSPNAFNGNRRQ